MKDFLKYILCLCLFSSVLHSEKDLFMDANIAFSEEAYSIASGLYLRYITINPHSSNLDDAYYYLGLSYYYLGEYDKSSRYFTQLLQKFKRSSYRSRAYYWLGQSYFMLGEIKKAREQYEIVIKHYPKDEYADASSYSIGFLLYKDGRYEEALYEFDEFLKIYKDSVFREEVHLRRGLSLLNLGDEVKGVEAVSILFEEARGLYKAKAAYHLGLYYYKKGKILSGEKYFREAVKEKGEHFENANIYLIQIRLDQRDYEEASLIAEKYLKESGQGKGYINYLYIKSLLLLGTERGAIEHYESIRENIAYEEEILTEFVLYYIRNGKESEADVYINRLESVGVCSLSKCLLSVGDYYNDNSNTAKAIQNYDRALSLCSEKSITSKAFYAKALIFLKEKNNSKAAEFFEKAFENEEKYSYFVAYVESVILSKEYEKALKLIENNIDRFKQNENSLTEMLSYIYFEKGDYEFAKKTLYTITNSTYAQTAYNRLALIAYNERDYDKAEQYFKKVYQDYSTEKSYKALKNLGTVYMHQKNYDKALDAYSLYEEAVVDEEEKAEAIFKKAWCYFYMGKYEKAASVFMEAKNKYKSEDSKIEASLRAGKAYYNAGKYLEAEEVFVSLTNENTISEEALYDLGSLYFASKKPEKALNSFYALINRFPKGKYKNEAVMKIADYKYLNGDYKESASLFEEVSSESKSSYNEEALLKQARALSLNNENKKAIEMFRRYLNEYPNGRFVGDANFFLAEEYALEGFHERARGFYKEALNYLAEESRIIEIKMAMAKGYRTENQYDKWESLLKEVLTNEKTPIEIKNNINYLLAKHYDENNSKEAQEYYETFIQNAYEDDKRLEEVLFRQARFYMLNRDYTMASKYLKTYYEAFNENGENRIEALFYLGVSSYYASDVKKSMEYFRYLLKTYPNSKRSGLVTNILKELVNGEKSVILEEGSYTID